MFHTCLLPWRYTGILEWPESSIWCRALSSSRSSVESIKSFSIGVMLLSAVFWVRSRAPLMMWVSSSVRVPPNPAVEP